MIATDIPFPTFPDLDGRPLDAGYVYFGARDENPETDPVTVYWDADGTQPATQPIRTLNGYLVRNGTPALVYVNSDYSMTVRNSRRQFVFYAPSSVRHSTGTTDDFTCADGQTEFTLSRNPGGAALTVVLDGLVLKSSDYTLSGTTLTLATAAFEDQELSVRYALTLPIGAVDASQVSYTPAGTGAVTTNVQAKLRESTSAADLGADTSGAASVVTPLTNLFAQTIGLLTITAGTYNVATDVTPAARDVAVRIDPTAAFTGAGKLRIDNLLPFQIDPLFSNDLEQKTYGPEFDSYSGAFQLARHAKGTISSGSVAVVALYGTGEAASANTRAFGANLTGFVTADGGRATGVEVDAGFRNGATTGNAYGVTIVSAGAGACTAAVQIQCQDLTAEWGNGINFTWNTNTGSGNVSGAAVRFGSNGGAASCQRFLYATGDMSATSAEIDFPSFLVQATPANVVNRIAVQGAATGVSAKVKAIGSDTNVNLEIQSQGTGVIVFRTNSLEGFRVASSAGTSDNLQATAGVGNATLTVRGSSTNADVRIDGKGSGGVLLRDGAGTTRLRVNTTGLGLFGANPVAQPTTAGAAATFVANAGTAVNDASTFDGYTLPQIAKALRNIGALA